ncbi:hypothetical protein HC823_02390 [Candidatus Gracilibacteria bacterium]|nr:hypothetical protein [Candidatus Gracilibacteria bacterium]
MRRLTEPLIEKDGEKTFVWEHWETSGIIGNIENDIMDVNIYTCKYFNPEEALDFTKTRIGDILESIQKF